MNRVVDILLDPFDIIAAVVGIRFHVIAPFLLGYIYGHYLIIFISEIIMNAVFAKPVISV